MLKQGVKKKKTKAEPSGHRKKLQTVGQPYSYGSSLQILKYICELHQKQSQNESHH